MGNGTEGQTSGFYPMEHIPYEMFSCLEVYVSVPSSSHEPGRSTLAAGSFTQYIFMSCLEEHSGITNAEYGTYGVAQCGKSMGCGGSPAQCRPCVSAQHGQEYVGKGMERTKGRSALNMAGRNLSFVGRLSENGTVHFHHTDDPRSTRRFNSSYILVVSQRKVLNPRSWHSTAFRECRNYTGSCVLSMMVACRYLDEQHIKIEV